ncbi:MAG TPA: oxidoreductase [Vitreimonas sp.]|nr:oxidoreductase [Vitreimonas sp.]
MADTFKLGGRTVKRMGYGAMQLAGPGVFGPPKDRAAAIAVLRAAIEAGVNHIDTSDYYGPYVVNEIIHEALYPYPKDLVLVTKLGGKRDDKGAWLPAQSPDELKRGLEDNLKRLNLDVMEVANLRIIGAVHQPSEGSIADKVEVMAQLKEQGLLRHIGLSNVTANQVAEARSIADIVCVQNHYNLAHRHDDALVDSLASDGIAYVPFFPLGGFSPIQSDALSSLAERLGATPLQVALAWLLHRSPNILLIPGTSSVAHLSENLNAAQLKLSPEALSELDNIASKGAS